MVKIGSLIIIDWERYFGDIWYRPVENESVFNTRISLMKNDYNFNAEDNFETKYKAHFWGKLKFLESFYHSFHGKKITFPSLEEAKDHVDQFLVRIEKLKLFY